MADVTKKISSLVIILFLSLQAFCTAANADSGYIARQKEAIKFIDSVNVMPSSGAWPHVNPDLFLKNLKLNIHNPLSFYPGRGTNFCSYGALSYLVIRDNPLGYAKFMISIYREGTASYNNIKFKPSSSVMSAAGTLRFKGVLDIRHAEQIWFLTLADHFKGYLNVLNLNYDLSDENTFWAATNLSKFNRMMRKMCNYRTSAAGSDLMHPWITNVFKYLSSRQDKGILVLYINNRIIHKKNHDKIKFSIPTHFVVLENIVMTGDRVTLTYWDYGGKTLLQVTPSVLKKIIYGISFAQK